MLMNAGRKSPESSSFIGEVLSGSERARKKWNRATIRLAGAVAVIGWLAGAPLLFEGAVAAGAVDKGGDEFFDSQERLRKGKKK